jgi:hypothetical protein
MSDKTVAQLFEMAIAAEKAAEELYHGLKSKFARHQEVADFWQEYADEEAMHANWLRQMRDSLTPEQLAQPADASILQSAHRAFQVSVEKALKGVKNLDDAYELVNDLENSETNAVFEFIIGCFGEDEKAQTFLRSQLRDHIGRLIADFPTQFRTATARRGVGALD